MSTLQTNDDTFIFKIENKNKRKSRKKIVYNNKNYHFRDTGYYVNSNRKGNKLLHVQMYEDYWNCIVPKEFSIHHKDENKEHNEIDNFFLLTVSGHHRWHSTGKVMSKETKTKISKAHIGKTMTSVSIANKQRVGKKYTEEAKKNMRLAWIKRKQKQYENS